MHTIDLPRTFTHEGKTFVLNVETSDNSATLTYEYEPIIEDSFLIATHSDTIMKAARKMMELLQQMLVNNDDFKTG